jgi:hypothetical protein
MAVQQQQQQQVGPYAGVDIHLRGLAGAAEGFGSAAIGGLHGEVYHVTSLAGIVFLYTPPPPPPPPAVALKSGGM